LARSPIPARIEGGESARIALDASIVIPVYDGAAFVGASLPELSRYLADQAFSHELIVVDDGSTDDTARRVEALALPHARLLRLSQNRGKFGALAAGVAESGGDCVLFTDADVPYDVRVIGYMVRLVREQGFDVVLGDRTLPESLGRVETRPLRRLGSALFRTYVRLLVTSGIYDTQCGVKAFRGDVARLLFPLLREPGFTGDVELINLALRYNLAVRRVPVHLVHQGASSVRVLRDGLGMVLASVRIRARRRRGAYDSEELAELARQGYWDEPAGGAGSLLPFRRAEPAAGERRLDGTAPAPSGRGRIPRR